MITCSSLLFAFDVNVTLNLSINYYDTGCQRIDLGNSVNNVERVYQRKIGDENVGIVLLKIFRPSDDNRKEAIAEHC